MTALGLDALVHDLVPVLAGEDLEDGEQRDRECVEVGRWGAFGKVKLAAKQLHAQQGKDQNEQKEKEQQRNDGTHGVQQGDDEIAQGGPVFGDLKDERLFKY